MSDLDEFDEPTFEIWHPTCTTTDSRSQCRMDLTKLAFYQLNEGNRDCMAALLTSAEIAYTEIISWNIHKYCTPYYADPYTNRRWGDRLPIAWRASIEIESMERPPKYLTQGPYETNAYDPTFIDVPESWRRGRENCIVIADSTEAPSSALVELLPDRVEVLDYTTPGAPLFQIRADLGTLNFPEDLKEVDQVLSIFHLHGLWTNWEDSMHGRLNL